jgi:hypothetical protein
VVVPKAASARLLELGAVIVAINAPCPGPTRTPLAGNEDKLPLLIVMYFPPTGVGSTIGPANTAPAGNTISCSTELFAAARLIAACNFAALAVVFR